MPSLSKISPIAGFKRLFGQAAWVNFAKGLAKLTIVGAVMGAILWPQHDVVVAMVNADVAAMTPMIFGLTVKLLAAALAILAFVALGDWLYQRHAWYERQKMTVQELKEEFKQSEGNPEVKAKIKQIRRQRASKRMMANVPKASVVITNPTHFAVALRYEPGMAAPICVAKGIDQIALKIREVAGEHEIPIVENPPLARALHATVDIDREIPGEHYRAVAEVISYVMKLRRGRLSGNTAQGRHP
jgi:flagellar biosynthetic protein FlhB